MPERSDLSLEEFKARLPLVDVVGRYVRLTRRGREYVGLCPFHHEKTPSFTVSEAKGFFHCFGCGQHGNALDFVMALEGLSFAEAVARLADLTGLPAPRRGEGGAPAVDRSLYAANEAAAHWFRGRLASPEGRPAARYLSDRGLDQAIIERFGLGYAPDQRNALKRALAAEGFDEDRLVEAGLLIRPEDGGPSFDRFRHRVIFPIADLRGRVVGFGARALGPVKAKYLNTPETAAFHKGELLYGVASARGAIRRAGTVIVVEGYMDVIALAQAGFDHAVAPLGTAIGEAQIGLLWRLADEPIVCLDGDRAGLTAGHRLIERALPLLRAGKSLRFAILPPGRDPDSLLRARGAAMLGKVLGEAISLDEFLWSHETATRSIAVPQQRAALERRFRELAASIPDRALARLFLDAFFQRIRQARGRSTRGLREPGAPFLRDEGRSVGPARLAERLANAAVVVERDLLGPLIAHPELLVEVEEELAALELSVPELEALRQAILAWYGEEGHLDPTGLGTHLTEGGFAGAVAPMLAFGPSTAWYVQAHAEPGMVLDSWRARLRSHHWFQARRRASGDVGEAIASGRGDDARMGALSVDRLINDRSLNETRRRDRIVD